MKPPLKQTCHDWNDFFFLTPLFPRIHIQSTQPSSSMIYNRVCDYCGIDLNGRCVPNPSREFLESLKTDQVKSLETFQRQSDALFSSISIHEQSNISNRPHEKLSPYSNINNSILLKDLERFWGKLFKYSWKWLAILLINCVNITRNPQKCQTRFLMPLLRIYVTATWKNFKNSSFESFSRQLGVSDQKLRRRFIWRDNVFGKLSFQRRSH